MPDCPPNSEGVVVEGDCTLDEGTVLHFVAPDPTTEPAPAPLPMSAGKSLTNKDTMPETTDTPVSASDAADAQPSAGDAGALTATTEAAPVTGLDAEGVSKLAGAANGDSTMLIVLGVIGLAGAGTTWKFLTQWSEQRHEQKMKQLDIDERASGLGAAAPPPCQTAHVEMKAEMEALRARVAAVEKKATSLSADFDGEDLERQVKKLVKTVKAMQEGTH